jgi:hypothetical protein
VKADPLRIYAGRALDTAQSGENRLRAERRLSQMLARPMTAAVVTDLLSVLPPREAS